MLRHLHLLRNKEKIKNLTLSQTPRALSLTLSQTPRAFSLTLKLVDVVEVGASRLQLLDLPQRNAPAAH